MLKSFVISFVVLLSSGLAYSADSACPDRSDAEPARVLESDVQERRISNLSPTWNGPERFRFTWFSAYVRKDGRLDRICCYSSTTDISNVEAGILKPKLEDLRFTPASHDGKKLISYVNFTIIGVKLDSGVESRLFMNQLRLKEQYGIDYIAPQRVDQFGYDGSGHVRAELVAEIDTAGTPSNVRVSEWHHGAKSTQRKFLTHLSEQCFIPGFVEGIPTKMPFYEVIQR